jgi:hypothetical protein
MPTISKSWTDQTQIIGAGGGWVTLSGTTESFSSGVDLETNGYEGAHVIVEVDFDAAPTDDVEVLLYGSLDGSNWDDTPLTALRLAKGTDPHQISLIVRDVAHFRLGVKQTGATDSHNVRAYYEAWRWNSS